MTTSHTSATSVSPEKWEVNRQYVGVPNIVRLTLRPTGRPFRNGKPGARVR